MLALGMPLAPAPAAEGSMYSAESDSRMYESPSSYSPPPQPLLGTFPRPDRLTPTPSPSSSAAAVALPPARGLVSLRTPPRAPDPGPGLGRERGRRLEARDEDEDEEDEAAPPGKWERNGLSAIPHRSYPASPHS